MQLELSTNHWIHLPAEKAVLEAYKLGFKDIQIGTPHLKADIKKLNELKERLKLNYGVHAPFLATKEFIANPAYKDRKKLEKSKKIFLKTLENAKKLGAKKIVVHTAEPGFENSLESLENVLKVLCKKAHKNKQVICLENKMPECEIGFKEGEMQKVLEDVKKSTKFKNLKLCFDTGHALASYNGEHARVLEFLKDVAKDIGDVHLVPGTKEYDIHLPPLGDPHFYRGIIKILFENNYTGDLTFEVAPEVPERWILDGAHYIRNTIAEIYTQKYLGKND